MLGRTALRLTLMMLVMAFAGVARGQDRLQDHFSDAAGKVKAEADPAQKRAILDESFTHMIEALDKVRSSPLISKDDKAGIDRFKVVIQEKQDELAGLNGFERVPDAELNAFADYVVQDMEQADQQITISLTALLLILIIVILLA